MATVKPETITRRIGRNIRRLRQMRRLTRAALAERACVPVEQIRRNEAGGGPISAVRLYWLGQALDIPLDEFFRRDARGLLPQGNRTICTAASGPDDIVLAERISRSDLPRPSSQRVPSDGRSRPAS